LKELLRNDYLLAILSVWGPAVLITKISIANALSEAGVKKLIIFYLAMFAGMIASVFGNVLVGEGGAVVTGLVVGIIAGTFTGDIASGRSPDDLRSVDNIVNFFAGGLAGGTVGMLTYEIASEGMLLHYAALLLAAEVATFGIAKLVCLAKDGVKKKIGA